MIVGKVLRCIIFVLCLIRVAVAQEIKFPAQVALNSNISFIIDTVEMKTYNLFPAIKQEGLISIALFAQDRENIKVVALYHDGHTFEQKITWYAMKLEWQKVGYTPVKDSIYNDVSISRSLYPGNYNFLTLDNNSEFIPISDKSVTGNNMFYIHTGISYTLFRMDEGIPSFYVAPTLAFEKFSIMPYYFVGGKKGVDLGFDNSEDIAAHEFGILYGRILGSNPFMITLNCGISWVSGKITYYEWQYRGFFNSSKKELYSETSGDVAFPLGFDILFPTTSAIGIDLKTLCSFNVNRKTNINVGIGIRFGRAVHKGLPGIK